MVFLYLAFRSYIIFQGRLVPLVECLEASQDTIVLFVLPLLVSYLDSVRRTRQSLLRQVYLLKSGAVPLYKVLQRFDLADKSLLIARILTEVIGHELLLGRLHNLVQIGATLANQRIKTADVSFENFSI